MKFLSRIRYLRKLVALAIWEAPPGVDMIVLTRPGECHASVEMFCGEARMVVVTVTDMTTAQIHQQLNLVANLVRAAAGMVEEGRCPCSVCTDKPEPDPLSAAMERATRTFLDGMGVQPD